MAADMRGKDSAKPTPAPVNIAPIKKISNIILIGPDCSFRSIPEKVSGVVEFFINETKRKNSIFKPNRNNKCIYI